jgi:hypothetical protein
MLRRRPVQLVSRLRELTLPRAERHAARAERLAERQMRRERDNKETAARRAGAVHAESHSRHSGGFSQRWRD